MGMCTGYSQHRVLPCTHGDQRSAAAPARRARRRRPRPARGADRTGLRRSCRAGAGCCGGPSSCSRVVAAGAAVAGRPGRRVAAGVAARARSRSWRSTRSSAELLRTVSLAYAVVAGVAAWALGGVSALASGRGARETRFGIPVALAARGRRRRACWCWSSWPATPARRPSGADRRHVTSRLAASRAASSRRNDSTRSGSASPAATASSSPHSGSSVPWVQPRGQSSVISSRSGKASIRCSGWTCASPKERMPGVSMIQPLAVGQLEQVGAGGGVPAAAGDGVDDARPRGGRRAPAR